MKIRNQMLGMVFSLSFALAGLMFPASPAVAQGNDGNNSGAHPNSSFCAELAPEGEAPFGRCMGLGWGVDEEAAYPEFIAVDYHEEAAPEIVINIEIGELNIHINPPRRRGGKGGAGKPAVMMKEDSSDPFSPLESVRSEGKPSAPAEKVAIEDHKRTLCADVYAGYRTVNKCMTYPPADVQQIYKVYRDLKSLLYSSSDIYTTLFETLFEEDMSLLLSVGSDPLEETVEIAVTNTEAAKRMLTVIAFSEAVASALHNELDEDYYILSALLRKAGILVNDGRDGKDWNMTNHILPGKSLFDMIAEVGNDSAFKYVHRFLIDDCNDETQCLKNYCNAFDALNVKILNPGTAAELFEITVFEDWLQTMILWEAGKDGWKDQTLKSVYDVDDDWWTALCGSDEQEEEIVLHELVETLREIPDFDIFDEQEEETVLHGLVETLREIAVQEEMGEEMKMRERLAELEVILNEEKGLESSSPSTPAQDGASETVDSAEE